MTIFAADGSRFVDSIQIGGLRPEMGTAAVDLELRCDPLLNIEHELGVE